ncbi:S-adenosyl-L-methionine-dependent uroporphyrinogen III methyltransferase, chloroplastic-like [Miscanthus floridulus]|uniref:S-adenosyl-L-methionine-dependent uroporphyrinogen III methyltransferase, chloroplastic-like n=1 Tax=Miscanthus floridulus TaxID=154761 RepID=UPI00345A9C22
MALAVRTPCFQPRPASISALATPTSTSLAAANARPHACVGAAVRASPFTEATSSSRYRHVAWSYATDGSSNSASPSSDAAANAAAAAAAGRQDNEIALQLPELWTLLDALRASRERGAEGRDSGGGPGRVALVGTGPRDPELLMFKAVQAIKAADLVLYDRLVSNDVLDLVREGARLLYVGKTAAYHDRTQEETHELLLSFAEAGANVVRLKGGDPLVYGRGGEEMDFLQQQEIKVEVIPGITSALGIAAGLGIPLTHRGVATRW